MSFLENQTGLSFLGEAAGEVGLALEVILVRVVPPMKSDAQRLGDRRGVDTRQIRLVVEGVGGGIPKFDVIAELTLLLLAQFRDRHLNLNTRGLSCNSVHNIGHTVISGGSCRLRSARFCISAHTLYFHATSFDAFGVVIALEEVVLVDGRLTVQAIRPEHEVKGLKEGRLTRVVVADQHRMPGQQHGGRLDPTKVFYVEAANLQFWISILADPARHLSHAFEQV